MRDNEGHEVEIKIFPDYCHEFISLKNKSLLVQTDKWTNFKDHNLYIVLSDGNLESIKYPFILGFTNSAPFFTSKLKNVKMLLNEEYEYHLPETGDEEHNPVEIRFA
jgi:hypothetical protein